MNRIIQPVLRLSVMALLLAAPGSAFAVLDVGLKMRAAYAGDDGCLGRYSNSFAAITNNCDYAVEVAATINVSDNTSHPTSIFVLGNNTWCQTVTINAVGNGADVGPTVWTAAGPPVWQGLTTGSRYVWPGTGGLLFRCGLEPGGVIGSFTAL